MFRKKVLFIAFLFLSFWGSAQITTLPALPVANKSVTITFDSSKESRLGFFTGDLYAHTGLITEESTSDDDWKYVIESWGNNTTQPKLSNKGNGIYELEITPDIYTFYAVPISERITKLALVFRSSDGNKQTNNLYVTVFNEGLNISISSPKNNSIQAKNETVGFSATASSEADLKLKINETTISENTGNQISTNYTFAESGTFWLIAEATSNNETVSDSVQIFIRENVIVETKPAAYKKGINYPTNNSAALVLWAPLKEFVFVLGDFNNWTTSNDFQMKKDGDYFWLEIPNLESGNEYLFQYLIDGEIKIADPYTEKIADPWNDKYISNDVYPDLIQFPENKTEGIASVLQPGQEEYNWETTDFQIPEKEKLIIYELLVRDFTTEHTYKAVREKLDYLEDLRINVLELMPVNEFEENSSWGYNPSFYFAPDKYYGPKNELKKLIDECHKRGIAVVIDMVLNHSYGQSPFVQMYMDNWTILPENPWYNVTSPNQTYSWGFDFNHEAEVVKELVDSVNSFWMNEYNIDGFRFDFTKGFTNTPGDGWAYDAARIEILKRMSTEIWKRKSDAIVIFEHLSDNSEEKVLSNHNILLWGNMNGAYREAGRGNTGESDLSWGVYKSRGWEKPNLVSYPESHDEERIMYTLKLSGITNGDYNVKNQSIALNRIELNSVFYLPLPGPKMIWQFGERGYDLSINRCENGSVSNNCRLSPKPPYWQYLNNPDRTDLFHVMAKLNELKQTYPEFAPETFDYNLSGALKWYRLNNGNNHVLAVGNFGTSENAINVTFQENGKWYEFFSHDSVEINNTQQNITLAPGEYRLYSTRNFDDPHVVTENKVDLQKTDNIRIYPNPATHEINISASENISEIQVYAITGKQILIQNPRSVNHLKLNTEGFAPGIYLLKIVHDNRVSTLKFVKE